MVEFDGKAMYQTMEQELNKDWQDSRISQVLSNENFPQSYTTGVANMRSALRKFVLSESNAKEIVTGHEQYFVALKDYYSTHVERMELLHGIVEKADVRLGPFLEFHKKCAELFGLWSGNVYTNMHPTMDFDIKTNFLSAWEVIIIELSTRPEGEMFVVTRETKLTEVDYDGTKEKTGVEIIRRGGECDGVVFIFLFVEDKYDGDTKIGKIFHFYSIACESDQMRHMVQDLHF